MNLAELNPDQLANAWIAAKQSEERANAERVAIEQEIVKHYPAKEEGAETHELPCGFKVEITGKLGYKCENIDTLKETLATAKVPQEMWPIDVSPRLDETGAKWLRKNKPEYWQRIAADITTKPAKTAIKVKV